MKLIKNMLKTIAVAAICVAPIAASADCNIISIVPGGINCGGGGEGGCSGGYCQWTSYADDCGNQWFSYTATCQGSGGSCSCKAIKS